MKRTIERVRAAAILAVTCLLFVAGNAWAEGYTYSNVDSDTLAVKRDGKFGTTSFSFQLSSPSANAATADFPSSGYVQLTKISISARSDNRYQNVATATLTNNKTSESYTATVTYSDGNDFSATKPAEWTSKEVLLTFATDGVLVDTTATYTLAFRNSSGTAETLGYSVVTTVASGTTTSDWKPAMRIYGRTPSGSMEMPSSLIPSSGGVPLPSTVIMTNATDVVISSGSSITLGSSGIQVAYTTQPLTVMAKVENIPTTATALMGFTLGGKSAEIVATRTTTGFQNGWVSTNGGNFGNNNGNFWGSASTTSVSSGEHWFALAYASDTDYYGSNAYLDGSGVACTDNPNGLRWTGGALTVFTIGGSKATINNYSDASGMVIKDVLVFNTKLTAAQVAKVTTALNNGWTVNAAGTTLTSSESLHALPGVANVSAIGTVTVASDGTLGLSGLTAVQVGSGATLDLSAAGGLTQVIVLSGGELTIGKLRPTSVVVMSGGTLNVSSSPSVSECITGYIPTATLSVESSSYLTGTVKLDGETVTPVIEGTTATLTGTTPIAADPTYTGDSWWWDYEFNGTVTSIGSDKGGMTTESSSAPVYYNNSELYFQQTPWRNATFNDKSELTAVMYCAPGNYANSVLVGFGSTTQGDQKAIALVTGANPSSGEMKLVLTDGHNGGTGTVTELADLTAVGATTTKHLYAFVMDRITENETTKTRIRVYLDGKVKAIYKHNGTLTLSNGFQIGSLHGGVYPRDGFNTGLSKYSATGDSGTLDFLRVVDATLTGAAMSALANAYPYNSVYGSATRAPVSASANWVETTEVWTQTVPGQADATQTEPNPDTNVTLSKGGSSDVSVDINLSEDSYYESLTLAKEAGATGSLKLTSAYGNDTSGKLVSAETSVLVDTTVPGGRVHLGVTSIADGITLTVDPFSGSGNYTIYNTLTGLGFGEVYEDVVISMALLGDGASVVLDSTGVSDLASAGFTAELVYNSDNLSYTFKVTREAATADIAVNIAVNGTTTWTTRGVLVPAPASIPDTYDNTVTITSAFESPVTIATSFAGGNVTVSSGGPVTLTGAITTSGTVTLNSATTLSGNTVSGALTGSGAVTIDGTVTLADGGSIANTINGSGTLALSSIPKTLSFGTWTGTVVLPELDSIAGDTFSFNSYGIEGSTVRINDIGGGWLRNEEVNPTIDIPEGKTLTISAFSASFNNTFKALSGSGTFSVTYNTDIDTTAGDWYSNYSAYYLIKDVSDFTGSLSTATPGIAIGDEKPAYQTAGGKILLTSAGASLTVTSASPAPGYIDGTTVSNHRVISSTVDGLTTYTDVVRPGTIFLVY